MFKAEIIGQFQAPDNQVEARRSGVGDFNNTFSLEAQAMPLLFSSINIAAPRRFIGDQERRAHLAASALPEMLSAAIGLTETEESEEGFRLAAACASLAHAQWDIDHSR